MVELTDGPVDPQTITIQSQKQVAQLKMHFLLARFRIGFRALMTVDSRREPEKAIRFTKNLEDDYVRVGRRLLRMVMTYINIPGFSSQFGWLLLDYGIVNRIPILPHCLDKRPVHQTCHWRFLRGRSLLHEHRRRLWGCGRLSNPG